jgi:hypothetical protein
VAARSPSAAWGAAGMGGAGRAGGGFDCGKRGHGVTSRQARELAGKARQHAALVPKRPATKQQANHEPCRKPHEETRRLTSACFLPSRGQTGFSKQGHHGKAW